PGINYALAGQTVNFNRIPSYDYFDLTAQFDIEKRYQLVIGMQNMFNRQPPIVGGQAGTTAANSGNTFPSSYDALGRTFSVAVRAKF
ncbi:MAG: TonB-dependent receptor, partial [Sphingomonadales bacterium]|nr:TonB-dependent receptor [Sphingomonadales bacterium]